MTIAIVQGTRPEIIKNYALVSALRAADARFVVLDTVQHSDPQMSAGIYQELGYAPTRRLTGTYRIGAAIDWLRDVFRELEISQVIVNGDTAASVAGSIAALYNDIDLAHVEAGLRADDPIMIEERNRIIVDSIATDLFAYTAVEKNVLCQNPNVRGRVHLLGNTTVDLLHDFAARLQRRPRKEPYIFATMHRKEFTDHSERMRLVFSTLEELSKSIAPIVFALHPRTKDCANQAGIDLSDFAGIRFIAPLGIFAALAHQKHAVAVVTDSGCIQEEAYLLQTQCVTVRETTERQLTVANHANTLTGFSRRAILDAVNVAKSRSCCWPDIYGAPGVGRRIIDTLLKRADQRVAAA